MLSRVSWALAQISCIYLADICSWPWGTRHNHTGHRTRLYWRPVNSEACRRTACSIGSARRSDTCGRTARDNAPTPACHCGHTVPSRTWAGRRRRDTTVPGSCWSKRISDASPAAMLHTRHTQQSVSSVLNEHKMSPPSTIHTVAELLRLWCRPPPPRTPFGHIWALIWSGVGGNIARTAL